MMVLTDPSRHDWLEGVGPHLTLVGFQDDATSRGRALPTRTRKYATHISAHPQGIQSATWLSVDIISSYGS
jgi:hypothetical protein